MKAGVRVWIIVACCVVLVIGIWIAMSKRQAEVSVTAATPAPSRSQDLPSPAPQTVPNPPPPSSTVATTSQTPATVGQMRPTAPASTPASPLEPPRSNPPATSPTFVPPPVPEDTADALIDLNKVSLMVRDYRTLMGENPIGTNAEIMKSILGANPKGAKLGPPEGQSLNSNGELIDRWGTPYFFHQLSATRMEIWSAGPDRKIGTSDDIIQK